MTRSTGQTSHSPLPGGNLTVVFTDIVNSTTLKGLMPGDTSRRRDASYRTTVKEPHDRRVLGLVEQAGGVRVASTGDGFFFTFEDADEAVLCALAIQRALHAEPIVTPLGQLAVRIGIHTGPVNAPDASRGATDYASTTVDKAQRVQAAAGPGEVFVSSQTHSLVNVRSVTFAEQPPAELKGFGPTTLYRAMAEDIQQPAQRRIPLSEFDNPYDFIGTARRGTFKGRTREAEELMQSVGAGTHTAIFGLQRMGKTSLNEQGLDTELQRHPDVRNKILLATIDMQRLGGAEVTYRDFAGAIFESVITQLAALGLGREVHNLRAHTRELFDASQYQRGDRTEFFAVFARLIRGLATTSRRRIVLFIDEFSEIRNVIERNNNALRRNPYRVSNLLPHDMFIDVPFIHHLSSLLRDADVKSQFTVIVLVRPFLAEYDAREDLQLLKLMKPITLRHLDESAARELITEPLRPCLSLEDAAVDYLVKLTAGHPYLLQFILSLIVDKMKHAGRVTLSLDDVKAVEERMVSDGPEFDAQFEVLISDYSIDEVTHAEEAQVGKGLLALISKYGQPPDGWVFGSQIFEDFARYRVPEAKTTAILDQLTRTRILEESTADDRMRYRLAIPLVQRRFLQQNLFLKYFRHV